MSKTLEKKINKIAILVAMSIEAESIIASLNMERMNVFLTRDYL